jgi:hypothetical protein
VATTDFQSLTHLHKQDFKHQSSIPLMEHKTSLAFETLNIKTSKNLLSPSNSKTVKFSPNALKEFHSLTKIAESSDTARETVFRQANHHSRIYSEAKRQVKGQSSIHSSDMMSLQNV